jgi:serine/threonine protein kinase
VIKETQSIIEEFSTPLHYYFLHRGMDFLHSRTPPLAHKDLRSPNIVIVDMNHQAEVNAKILDFGLTEFICGKTRFVMVLL